MVAFIRFLLISLCLPLPLAEALTSMSSTRFTPLDPESLVSAKCLIEQTLCQPTDDQPQLAKDFLYADAVLEAWKQQEADSAKGVWNTEWSFVTYHTEDGTPLHGHLVRNTATNNKSVPGVIFFHTGAGPHDLFLLWKAAALVNDDNACVVLIADILSDPTGWAWDPDRTQYNQARNHVLQDRALLQSRIQAAVATLQGHADLRRMAAMGWCLGGHSILELGRMRIPGMRAMATFHGVFDGAVTEEVNGTSYKVNSGADVRSEVLICNGRQDPFVSNASLEQALALFQSHHNLVSLLQLKGAKHGFTNPAQDFNDNPAFAFHQESADKAWRQATALLKRRCFDDESS